MALFSQHLLECLALTLLSLVRIPAMSPAPLLQNPLQGGQMILPHPPLPPLWASAMAPEGRECPELGVEVFGSSGQEEQG